MRIMVFTMVWGRGAPLASVTAVMLWPPSKVMAVSRLSSES